MRLFVSVRKRKSYCLITWTRERIRWLTIKLSCALWMVMKQLQLRLRNLIGLRIVSTELSNGIRYHQWPSIKPSKLLIGMEILTFLKKICKNSFWIKSNISLGSLAMLDCRNCSRWWMYSREEKSTKPIGKKFSVPVTLIGFLMQNNKSVLCFQSNMQA